MESRSVNWSEETALIREHYQPAQTWEPETLENWLSWAASNSFLVRVFDKPKKLVGLCIFRPMKPERAKTVVRPDDQFDEDGDIIYVDLAVSTKGKPVLQSLLLGVLARLGNRQCIAYFMNNRNGKFKIHSLDTFRKTLLKVK